MTQTSYITPPREHNPSLAQGSQLVLPYPSGFLADQLRLRELTGVEDYSSWHPDFRVDRDLADWHIPTPENGWKSYWVAAGLKAASTSYLEQRAKPHTIFKIRSQNPFGSDPKKTCESAGYGRFAMTGFDAEGKHQVAKVLSCGREWCLRCGKNAEPGVPGSDAHQRRIARWLPKAQQIESMGYFVFTIPPELRIHFRDTDNLSHLSRRFTLMMKRYGFDRGLRRWHWFGELENAPDGENPDYHPHINALVDGEFVEKEDLDRIRRSWGQLLRRVCGLDWTPDAVIHYQYVSNPAQKYHKVRYVTRATFKSLYWDDYMAMELYGFRNSQTWGSWNDDSVWEPVPEAGVPGAGIQQLSAGNCPSCKDSPIEWESHIVSASGFVSDTRWLEIGAGYFVRDLSPP